MPALVRSGLPARGGKPGVQLVTLELGECRHDSEHRPAHRSGSADPFGDITKVRAPLFQIINQGQQVPIVASQSIELSHHDLIAMAQVVQKLIELRAARCRSTHPMIDGNPVTTRSFQC